MRKSLPFNNTYQNVSTLSIYIYSHQDAIKGKANLTFPEKLNDLADNIAGTYAKSPINNHIPMTPLAVYINKQYIPNNY